MARLPYRGWQAKETAACRKTKRHRAPGVDGVDRGRRPVPYWIPIAVGCVMRSVNLTIRCTHSGPMQNAEPRPWGIEFFDTHLYSAFSPARLDTPTHNRDTHTAREAVVARDVF
jgi:hypothetical protein